MVRVFVLTSGMTIVGKGDMDSLKAPVIIFQNEQGVSFRPAAMYSSIEGSVALNARHITYSYEADSKFAKAYEAFITDVKAKQAGIVLPNK